MGGAQISFRGHSRYIRQIAVTRTFQRTDDMKCILFSLWPENFEIRTTKGRPLFVLEVERRKRGEKEGGGEE